MNWHRGEGKEVGSGHNEVDAFKFNSSRHKIITVNVTVEAIFNTVFVKHVDYLAADEVGENGGEMQEREKLLVVLASLGGILLKTLALVKAQL